MGHRLSCGESQDHGLFSSVQAGELDAVKLTVDGDPDVVNRHKQTPLVLAAMHGKIAFLKKLIEAGANILKLDSLN